MTEYTHVLQKKIKNRKLIEFVHAKLQEQGAADTRIILGWLFDSGNRHFSKSINQLGNILSRHKQYFEKLPNDGSNFNKFKLQIWGAVE